MPAIARSVLLQLGTLAAAALLLVPAPAAADLTARYQSNNGGPALLFEVSDKGEARVTREGEPVYSLLTEAGDFLVVQTNPAQSARYEDYQALLSGHVMRNGTAAILETLARMRGEKVPDSRVETVAKGTETVAGYLGQKYRIRFKNDRSAGQTAVTSSSPDLLPLAAAWKRWIEIQPDYAVLPPEKRSVLTTALLKLLESGALLRDAGVQLVEIRKDDIPADRFRLPSKLLTRVELAEVLVSLSAALNAQRRRKNGR